MRQTTASRLGGGIETGREEEKEGEMIDPHRARLFKTEAAAHADLRYKAAITITTTLHQ